MTGYKVLKRLYPWRLEKSSVSATVVTDAHARGAGNGFSLAALSSIRTFLSFPSARIHIRKGDQFASVILCGYFHSRHNPLLARAFGLCSDGMMQVPAHKNRRFYDDRDYKDTEPIPVHEVPEDIRKSGVIQTDRRIDTRTAKLIEVVEIIPYIQFDLPLGDIIDPYLFDNKDPIDILLGILESAYERVITGKEVWEMGKVRVAQGVLWGSINLLAYSLLTGVGVLFGSGFESFLAFEEAFWLSFLSPNLSLLLVIVLVNGLAWSISVLKN